MIKLVDGKLIVLSAAAACGKTTVSMELCATLKKQGVNAVYLPESVRGVFEKRALQGLEGALTRSEQTLVLMKQIEREKRLKKLYDVVITDNPLFSAVTYGGFGDERMEHELIRARNCDLLIHTPFLMNEETADGVRLKQTNKSRMATHAVLMDYVDDNYAGVQIVAPKKPDGYTDIQLLVSMVVKHLGYFDSSEVMMNRQ